MFDENTNHEIDDLIRRRTQVEVPADVEQRLRRRLAEFRTNVEQRAPSPLRALAYSLMHPPLARAMTMGAVLLLLVVVGLVLIPRGSGGGRVYAAAAEHLRSAQSLEYTIVLNSTPYVAVDFSFIAPGFQRLNCSWGIEVRADHTAGRQVILMHATRTYIIEEGKPVESLADSAGVVEQLRSLPQAANEIIGEQWAGQQRLLGYRVSRAPFDTSFPGLKALDLWIDSVTRDVHHVDITIQEEGKPLHQMHIKDIHVDADVNRSLFDLTPPAGYTPIVIPGSTTGAAQPGASQHIPDLRVEIRQADALAAVVMPMKGTYLQTPAALQAVEAHLKIAGVTPVGPPFGRYESEQHWEAGYPVPQGAHVEPPFQLIVLPGALVASAVVKSSWGKDSDGRWSAFLKSVIEQGYLPTGPAMEIWSGEDAKESTQSTEMRIPVTKAN